MKVSDWGILGISHVIETLLGGSLMKCPEWQVRDSDILGWQFSVFDVLGLGEYLDTIGS